jgi:hypothetical protein
MPPEAQPEQPQEVRPVRSKYDVLGVAYDYYKEAWGHLWRKERTELKKEVETQRGLIKKDGLKFHEMRFDEAGKTKSEQQLQNYVAKIPPLQSGEGRLRTDREPELSSGSAGVRRRGEVSADKKIKAAADLADRPK